MIDKKFEREILGFLEEDWVQLWVLCGVAENCGYKDSQVKPAVLDAVTCLLSSDLIQVGELDGESFTPWTGSSLEIVTKIDQYWSVLDRVPNPEDEIWFSKKN
ncbi:hypothetical protein DOM22_10945 [Bdellovibrio sp. ZAP7]|uniref:hypothetical protein n=1 Tax=Bdellovibrio sp. ZAP7 TaxID=2231053 RepID=UPI00115B8FF9|nr:hypothetical protein [Bdellovibrio sp. ZAP7]QDK45628.1 hypothetical protein DOM22_10945 [Bdellovibrio sp. ZAP7]